MKEIADNLCREIKRNSYQDDENPVPNGYHAVLAQDLYEKRCAMGGPDTARLARLRIEYGFDAFKCRVGAEVGRNVDEWPGCTDHPTRSAKWDDDSADHEQ